MTHSDVIALREGGEVVIKVVFEDEVTTPTYREVGPARAYLAMLHRGQRWPEVRSGVFRQPQEVQRQVLACYRAGVKPTLKECLEAWQRINEPTRQRDAVVGGAS